MDPFDKFDCGWNQFLLFIVLMSYNLELSMKYSQLLIMNTVIEYTYWAINAKLVLNCSWIILKNHINIILKYIVIRVIDNYTCIISK
jgi:hypothetical protein